MAIQSNFPAIKPSLMLDFANTKQLDPRITYTRASTATFYNGVTTAKAEENLMLQSQDFATTWTTSSLTVTANTTTAPDGTTTADSIIPTTAAGTTHRVIQSVTLPVASSVFSVYVKANGYTKVSIREVSVAGYYASFNLSAVTVLDSSLCTGSIVDAGNGWYRVTLSFTAVAGANIWSIFPLDASYTTGNPSSYTYTADGTSGLFVWGAQLEQRSAVTAYTATTTQAITNYIPALQTAASGVARFDNNPTTSESLGLLIEESRTNLFTYSAEFDNAGWSKSATTATANAIVSPDGTLTADKFISDSTSGFHSITQTLASKTASTAYTFSFYAKAGEIGFCLPNFSSGLTGSSLSCTVNLSTGAITGATSGLTTTSTSVGNGWWRFTLTATGAANTTGFGSTVNTTDASGTASHTGNGFSGIYIWGAQLEAGSFATSYIPTVASQVTRAADSASMTGTNFSSWYNYSEGTMYADGVTASAFGSSNQMIASIGDGSSSQNQVSMYRSSSAALTQLISSSGATQSNISSGLTATSSTNYKFITCYKVNDFAFSVNANTVQTDSSGLVPAVVNKLDIGNWHVNGTANWNSTIKKIAYYPLRVTNAQLQALTS